MMIKYTLIFLAAIFGCSDESSIEPKISEDIEDSVQLIDLSSDRNISRIWPNIEHDGRFKISYKNPVESSLVVNPEIRLDLDVTEWMEVVSEDDVTIQVVRAVSPRMEQDSAISKFLEISRVSGLVVDDIEEWKRIVDQQGKQNLLATRDFFDDYISISVEIIPSPSFDHDLSWRIATELYFVPDRHKARWDRRKNVLSHD